MAESSKRSAFNHDAPDFEPRKRGKYTPVACNECKRRKLKCSGGETCKRCASNDIACVYDFQHRSTTTTPRHERPQTTEQSAWKLQTLERRMSAMQRQLDFMSAEIGELQKRSSTAHQSIVKSSTKPSDARWTNRGPVSPTYIGPTSSEFGLNVPNDDAPESDETETSENGPLFPSNSARILPLEERQQEEEEEEEEQEPESSINISSKTPLLSLTEAEALRLVDVYEEAVGLMYPVVDLKSIREYIVDFYRQYLDKPGEHLSAPQNGNEAWWFSARDNEVLKIVLALALISESNGETELGDVLAASVENTFASTRTQVPEVDMKELIILTLVALYHSCRDDDVLAWRTIGLAGRGAMQMGLHRYDTWLRTGGIFPGDLERSWAINLFWCIYVFDKEFSFETGLPFSIRDSEMDSTLPEPADSHPYLNCMISYCRVGGKIWDLIVGWGSTEIEVSSATEEHLNYRIHEWEKSIPPEFRLTDFSSDNWIFSMRDARLRRLATPQILLHLRANQMRILVYKQYLVGTNSVVPWNLQGAETAVANAKDTIKTLKAVYASPIYVHRPHPFNRFLFSALATLFLAMFNLPDVFRNTCRDDFFEALHALKQSSARGKHSRRLQKVMKNLKRMNIKQPSNPVINRQEYLPTRAQRSGRATAADSEMRPTAPPPLPMDVNTSVYAMAPPPLLNENTPDDYSHLTNFFELAGDCFMDGHVDQIDHVPLDSSLDLQQQQQQQQQQSQSFVDMFQAENEALTRLMAGLL